MTQTALVLGVTGGIGGAVAVRLLASGWRVRGLVRDPAARLHPGIEPRVGDAMRREDVLSAAAGADLVVHAVNPPGYRDWHRLVLPMIDNSISAARANGARVLLPGTVCNYGPEAFPLISESAPQRSRTRKGAIRVELERRLRVAADSGEMRALVVRAGDFFGPGAANNWFGKALVTPGRRPVAVRQPGRRGIGHQWAYLPDVAETMVRLAEQDRLEPFETFHMDGHWDADGTGMPNAIVRALGDPIVPVKPLAWWMLRLAALVAATPHEMMEMRYLWREPVRLDNRRLLARLGAEPHTPLDEAVRTTLVALDCVAGPR